MEKGKPTPPYNIFRSQRLALVPVQKFQAKKGMHSFGKEVAMLFWKGNTKKDYGMSVIPDFTGDTAWSR